MPVFKKPESIIKAAGYCGGCGHGIIQRTIAESIEELGLSLVYDLRKIFPHGCLIVGIQSADQKDSDHRHCYENEQAVDDYNFPSNALAPHFEF